MKSLDKLDQDLKIDETLHSSLELCVF